MKAILRIPFDDPKTSIEVLYLAKETKYDSSGALYHMQLVRRRQQVYMQQFQNMKPVWDKQIEQALAGIINNYDAILSVPSQFPFASDFKNPIAMRFNTLTDLSSCLLKINLNVKSSTNTSLARIRCNYRLKITAPRVRKGLIIVDDILNGGKTAFAVLCAFKRHPWNCLSHVLLIAPLWIVE
jgi:predicted amidophosphoribosyltransferase